MSVSDRDRKRPDRPMHTSLRGWRAPLAAGCLAAVLYAGCVPIPNTVALSPAVTGTLKRDDRTPVAGAPLTLSVEYADSTCASPALRTLTDSAGRFAFPAVTRRERFTAVLFERLLCYSVCGGAAAGPMYHACFLHSVPPADTLSCAVSAAETAANERRTWCMHRPRSRR